MPEHRLFFAIQPDPPTAARIHALADRLRLDQRLEGAPIAPERLHITLGLVARGPTLPAPAVIAEATRRAGALAGRPFMVALNQVQSWAGSGGPLVLLGDEGVIGVDRLHAAIAAARGLQPAQGFVAHMSLIWSRDAAREGPVEPVRWMVREFVLIHSIHGEGRHRVLARFPLAGPGGNAGVPPLI